MNNKNKHGRIILALSLPLVSLLILEACAGLLIADFYAAETMNWQAQSTGQDMINLFVIAPCLVVTSVSAYKNNPIAIMTWGGIVLYLTYTFVIYCFDVHFNRLFLVYCFLPGFIFLFIYVFFVYVAEIGDQVAGT